MSGASDSQTRPYGGGTARKCLYEHGPVWVFGGVLIGLWPFAVLVGWGTEKWL